MAQKKLERFAQIRTFRNVLEYPEGMAGKWSTFFGNDQAVTLELACGKGEYAIGLGRLFPDRNFIGIDLKGNRIWVGARQALQDQLNNIAFIRSDIDKLPRYFNRGEVSDIWITFPDPQLRTSRAKKRLTHPRFLRLYQQVIAPAGTIHLKTDSPDLYRFTKTVISLYGLKLIADNGDVYANVPIDPILAISTHYEKLDIARSSRIHYLSFALPQEQLPDLDAALKEMIVRQEKSELEAAGPKSTHVHEV